MPYVKIDEWKILFKNVLNNPSKENFKQYIKKTDTLFDKNPEEIFEFILFLKREIEKTRRDFMDLFEYTPRLHKANYLEKLVAKIKTCDKVERLLFDSAQQRANTYFSF